LRLVAIRDKQGGYHLYLTNIPPEKLAATDIRSVYASRWQIELLFKEWKSYANLHAFDTGKSEIAEPLLPASPRAWRLV